MSFKFDIVGDAPALIARAAARSAGSLNKAVYAASTRVLGRAKVNVKTALNTTGQSKGTLGRSLQIVPDRAQFRAAIGPSVVYGAIHEFGGIITNGWGRGIKIRIPKRAYLQPALDDSRPEIENIFSDELKRLF